MRGESRRLRCALLCAALVLQSCFTSMLWKGWDDDAQVADASYRRTNARAHEGDWGWEEIGLRVVLTPVTLLLDLFTMPFQMWLEGDSNDDESSRRRGPC